MLVTNDSGSIASGPVVFGFLTAPDAVDPATERYTSPDATLQEDNRSTDLSGALRFACGCAWVENVPAGGSSTINWHKEAGSPSAGATKTINDLLTLAPTWDETIRFVEGASTYSVSLRNVLSTGSSTWTKTGPVVRATKWRDGPVCKEYVVHSPLYLEPAGTVPHDHLHVTATVAFFSGDNFTSAEPFVRVHSKVTNQWIATAGRGDIIGSGSITVGTTPSTAVEYVAENLTGNDLTLSAEIASDVHTLTRTTGIWPEYVNGGHVVDTVAGFRGFVIKRLSDTQVEVWRFIGPTSGTLSNATYEPLSLFLFRSWEQEVWWPSTPPLRAQIHGTGSALAAQMWPNYAIDSPKTDNATTVAELESRGSNPFAVGKTGSRLLLMGEERQDSDNESRELPDNYRHSLVARDGDYLASLTYDRIHLNTNAARALSRRFLDENTGLPLDIDDHIGFYESNYPTGSPQYQLGTVGVRGTERRDPHFYLPYLLTGDYWHAHAQMQEFIETWGTNTAASQGAFWIDGDIRKTLDAGQIRARAWADRTLAQTVVCTPDSAGDLFPMTKARLRTFTETNFSHLASYYVNDGSGNTGWRTSDSTAPNLRAEDEPMYLRNENVNPPAVFHVWQGIGYWGKAGFMRYELGEMSANAGIFYRRIHEMAAWHITHPDIDGKVVEADADKRRWTMLVGKQNIPEEDPLDSYTSQYRSAMDGDHDTYSIIWDEFYISDLPASPPAYYPSYIFSVLQAAKVMGVFTNTTRINTAYDWLAGYASSSQSWLTLSGGEPDFSTVATWGDDWWREELYKPRS